MTTPRVLYVEDTPQNRLLVKRIVESRGWCYQEAVNGQEALDALHAGPLPDVILMDLAMPVMDGYQATREIKATPEYQEIPVWVLTAHAMAGDRERAEEAGCDRYITKPIDTGELVEALSEFFRGRAEEDASEEASSGAPLRGESGSQCAASGTGSTAAPDAPSGGCPEPGLATRLREGLQAVASGGEAGLDLLREARDELRSQLGADVERDHSAI